LERKIAKNQVQVDKLEAKIAERDGLVAAAQRRAEEDRADVSAVRDELLAVYGDPAEIVKHARLVTIEEIIDNDHNLNIPRYVDTFEPEEPLEVPAALKQVADADEALQEARVRLQHLLKDIGYSD
jgi:type I restriction enzyme M protein